MPTVLPPGLGPHWGSWGQSQACSWRCWRPSRPQNHAPPTPICCALVTEAGCALPSGLEKRGVVLADLPEFWWAGKQVKPVITGKQPGACVDRPPGGQAGGLLKREGPRVWTLSAKSHRVGEGWLCNCDATATERMTWLCTTALVPHPSRRT